MMRDFRRNAAVLGLGTCLLAGGAPWVGVIHPASAQAAPAAKKGGGETSLLPGASSKDPVNIDAGKLDYFDKEQKLIYTGDVIAKQGDSTLKASILTIFLARGPKGDAPAAAEAQPASVGPQATSGNSVRRMEATGPVTVISKDQVGTGDNGVYDKTENKITLIGNVTLSQATNIIKGDTLVYDMTSGQAHVTSGRTQQRISSVFTPGSSTPGAAPAASAPGAGKPAKPSDTAKKTKRAKPAAAPARAPTTAAEQ